jgi:hypothetical protein
VMLLAWPADWQISTPQRPMPNIVSTPTQPIMRAQKTPVSGDGGFAWVIRFNQALDPDGRDLAYLLRVGWEIYSYDDSLS